jgi:hypothetical protein
LKVSCYRVCRGALCVAITWVLCSRQWAIYPSLKWYCHLFGDRVKQIEGPGLLQRECGRTPAQIVVNLPSGVGGPPAATPHTLLTPRRQGLRISLPGPQPTLCTIPQPREWPVSPPGYLNTRRPVPRASGTAALRSKIPIVEKEPRPATAGPQEGAERPWWRMVLGG